MSAGVEADRNFTMKRAGKGVDDSAARHSNRADEAKTGKSWAETNGIGNRDGFMGLSGALGRAVATIGTLALLICCPAFVFIL